MTKDEALDLALEALEMVVVDAKTTPTAYEAHRQAITAIKQARALDKKAENARELGLDYEPVKEHKPFAYANPDDLSADTAFRWCEINEFTMPVYTTPPVAQRTWVGLTDEEREQHRDDWRSNIHDKEFRAIEAKLKEKNT